MNITDAELWNSFKKGDSEAYKTLYFKYFNSLFEFGLRKINDKEIVRDSIQDLFLKLWTNKENLSNVTFVKAYLFVAFRSVLLNALVKKKQISSINIDEDYPFEMPFSIESEYIKNETNLIEGQKLIKGMNQLTPRQREFIYLRYYEQFSFEQTAEAMGITTKAVYKLSARCVEQLRDAIKSSTNDNKD